MQFQPLASTSLTALGSGQCETQTHTHTVTHMHIEVQSLEAFFESQEVDPFGANVSAVLKFTSKQDGCTVE